MDAFFDANVYLSFYLFSKDDLRTMEKVVKLVHDGEINVLKNEPLVSEISRNRDGKLSEGFKTLRSIKYGQQFPNYCKAYNQHDSINDLLKAANLLHRELVDAVESDIRAKGLAADILIRDVLDEAQEISMGSSVLVAARQRLELANPPGKARSLGDAIHWECLLSAKTFNLSIVSQDGDFASPLYPTEINSFLANEWIAKKGKHSKVVLFETLSAFLGKNFPKFELTTEARKDELIEALRASGSFAQTHAIVEALLQLGTSRPCKQSGCVIL